MLQAQVNSKLAFINSMIFRRDNMKTNKGRIEQSWRTIMITLSVTLYISYFLIRYNNKKDKMCEDEYINR